MGGKGSKRAREYREEGTACKDTIVFLFFSRPPDERKNPDWSNFMNYSIGCSDWSATCHSRESVFSHSFIQLIIYSTKYLVSDWPMANA